MGSGDYAGLTPPQPLASEHRLEAFGCGVPALDEWLRRRAFGNQSGYSRTYVVCDGPSRVVGFYCLSAGSVERADAPRQLAGGGPPHVPVVVLGRLAVDRAHQGRGLGRALLRDALLRSRDAAELIGIRAVIVHAKTAELSTWYAALGFVAFRKHPTTLMLPLEHLQAGRG